MAASAFTKDSFCSYCGTGFAENQPWPRQCAHCHNTSYRNPLPVVIVLVPVGKGVLVVRRNIEPQKGSLALPGGFIEAGETWQEAGAREVYEETGLTIDPASIQLLSVYSAPDNTIIIAGQSAPIQPEALADFAGNAEASERTVLAAPAELAWPLHTQAVQAFFSLQNPPRA